MAAAKPAFLVRDRKATETSCMESNAKQTETLKELIYIPEEGVYMNVCDLGKCVFTVTGEQVSSLQGHSCQGIKRNMTKRRWGKGKGSAFTIAGSAITRGGGDNSGNISQHR